MSVLGTAREAHRDLRKSGSSYAIHIPLSGNDDIDLGYPALSTRPHAVAMASIVGVLQVAVTVSDKQGMSSEAPPRRPGRRPSRWSGRGEAGRRGRQRRRSPVLASAAR